MKIESLIELKANPRIPAFRPGDSVRVHAKVIEGDRQRIQAFEGVVIRIRRGGVNSNFTVRRISHGIGVERIFPYFSPLVDKVDVVRVGSVRRAKLYYLRERIGKAGRIKAGSRARFEELTALPAAAYEEAEAAAEAEAAEEEEMAEEAATEEALTEEVVEAEAEAEVEVAAEEAPTEETPEAEVVAEEAGEEPPEEGAAAEEPAAEDDKA